MESIIIANAVHIPASTSNVGNQDDEECCICYEPFTNKAFLNECCHHFCYECIVTWTNINPRCPLCIQPVSGIINNIKSLDDYEIQSITPRTDFLADYDRDTDFPDYETDVESYDDSNNVSNTESDVSYDFSNSSNDLAILPFFSDFIPSNSTESTFNGGNIGGTLYGNSQDSFYNFDEDNRSDTNPSENSYDENDKDEVDDSESESDEYYEENNSDNDEESDYEEEEDSLQTENNENNAHDFSGYYEPEDNNTHDFSDYWEPEDDNIHDISDYWEPEDDNTYDYADYWEPEDDNTYDFSDYWEPEDNTYE